MTVLPFLSAFCLYGLLFNTQRKNLSLSLSYHTQPPTPTLPEFILKRTGKPTRTKENTTLVSSGLSPAPPPPSEEKRFYKKRLQINLGGKNKVGSWPSKETSVCLHTGCAEKSGLNFKHIQNNEYLCLSDLRQLLHSYCDCKGG